MRHLVSITGVSLHASTRHAVCLKCMEAVLLLCYCCTAAAFYFSSSAPTLAMWVLPPVAFSQNWMFRCSFFSLALCQKVR
jgi:hypothetical protein